MPGFHFSTERFAAMFPYYICLDKMGIIESYGKNIPQLCGIENGKRFSELFTCLAGSRQSDTLTAPVPVSEIIIIQSLTADNINFKGKFEYLEDGEKLLFLGTPSYVIGNEEIDLQLRLFASSYEQKLYGGDVYFSKLKHDSLANVVDYFIEKERSDELLSPRQRSSLPAITVSDNYGMVLWCNSYFEELSGRPQNEVIGKRPRDAIYGKRSVYIDKNFVDDNVRKGEAFYFENIGYTREGKEFWFGVIVQPVFNHQNELIGRVHMLRDISVRKLQELQHEENENLLALALEGSKVGAWSLDLITDEIKVSDLYRSIVGFRREGRITMEDYNKLWHPEDKTRFAEEILPFITATQPAFAYEVRFIVGDECRYFSVRGNCIQFGADNRPVKLVGVLRDHTDDKKRMLELEKQKQYYHKIIDQIPADIVICTLDHRYEYINKHAVKNDETRNWLLGKTDYDYCTMKGLPFAMADQRRALFLAAVTGGKQVRGLETKRNGDNVDYLMRIFSPLYDEQGKIENVIGYGVNVTEQVQNEKYALLQEKRIKNFLDIARDGVFSCSLDGTVHTYNSSFLKITGLDAAEGADLNFYSLLDPQERIKLKDSVMLLISNHQPLNGIFTIDAGSGYGVRHIDYTFILDAKDEPDGFVGRISDITEIVMRERNMQQIIENEVRLNKNKTQFIHITSHELRTPLTIIQSNSELLEMLLSQPDLMAKKNPLLLTQRIIREVELMTDILNQLMLVSRIESGNVEINKENVDVRQFVQQIAVSFTPYSDGRSLVVAIEKDVTYWEFDARIIKHALINLLSNAFKYSHGRSAPQLSIRLQDEQLQITVKDDGIGIPEEEINSLFQTFFRASNVGVISGTGIGLMIVEYAVHKHNGIIKVDSQLNKGAAFTICLP